MGLTLLTIKPDSLGQANNIAQKLTRSHLVSRVEVLNPLEMMILINIEDQTEACEFVEKFLKGHECDLKTVVYSFQRDEPEETIENVDARGHDTLTDLIS